MYNEVLLFPEKTKGQMIYPEDARKLFAQACDGKKIDPAIFARDGNGKTLQGRYGDDRNGEGFGIPPNIIFDGGNGFLRIYGLGQSGCDLLTENIMVMVKALREHLVDSAIRMEMKQGDMKLAMSMPTMYSIRRLVVEKRAKQAGHFFHVTAVERENEIKKIIKDGLISCARFIDENSETEFPQEYKIPSDDNLILDILEGEATPVEIKPGIRAAAFKNVTFCTNLDLNGPWSVGKLRSRGYGLIRRRIER